MQQFSNQEMAELKSRVDRIHDLLARHGDEGAAMLRPSAADRRGDERAQPPLLDQLSFSIEARRIRRSHFGGADMSGAVWDMMLDLMLARANARVLGASDLATGAGVPLSSGLRMIAALEQHGLVERAIDERDRRRTLVRLTDAGAERMASYFDRIGGATRGGRPLAA